MHPKSITMVLNMGYMIDELDVIQYNVIYIFYIILKNETV
jgi:hypothetical protein